MSEAANRSAEPAPQSNDPAPALEARRLLRAGLTATLATVGADGGPYASFVGYATRPDGSPLFLFSGLSPHTRNLGRDPRFSLLIAAPPRVEGDPMDNARLTLSGRIARSDDPADRARYLRRNPAAELYAGLADFKIHVGQVTDAHYVGGFARARGLPVAELIRDAADAAKLAEAEEGIVSHMNADHSDANNLYATKLLGLPGGAWKMTGIDPEGCDLLFERDACRIVFEAPIATPGEARKELVRLVGVARQTD